MMVLRAGQWSRIKCGPEETRGQLGHSSWHPSAGRRTSSSSIMQAHASATGAYERRNANPETGPPKSATDLILMKSHKCLPHMQNGSGKCHDWLTLCKFLASSHLSSPNFHPQSSWLANLISGSFVFIVLWGSIRFLTHKCNFLWPHIWNCKI